MTTGPKREFWLKLGLWPAVFVALAPMVVALLHLAPMAPPSGRPAVHHAAEHQPKRQAHHHHDHAAGAHDIAALDDAAPEDRHAAAAPPETQPADTPSHHARPHCPLCLWLQGFHALPAPEAIVLRRQQERAVALVQRDTPFRIAAIRATAQARAPPASLPA